MTLSVAHQGKDWHPAVFAFRLSNDISGLQFTHSYFITLLFQIFDSVRDKLVHEEGIDIGRSVATWRGLVYGQYSSMAEKRSLNWIHKIVWRR